ncbi:MAG: FecR domain-containing protein [Pseudomonadota bacterium]
MTPMKNADDAARYWVVREQSGTLSDAERKALQEWLENPGAAAAFRKAQRALAAADAHADALLQRQFEDELAALADQGAERPAPRVPLRAAIAAGLACLVVGAGLLAALSNAEPARTLATARGGSERLALKDGSVLTMNTATTLGIDYSRAERRVSLPAGEAFFDVARNPERPFVVQTPHGDVQVTGTSFNIETDDAGSTISVVSGSVRVRSGVNDGPTLLAGDAVSIAPSGAFSPVTDFDPQVELAWRDGKVRFLNTPLNDVAAELNRYFETPIRIGDASLLALPVTGDFSTRDQSVAVNSLALAFSLRVDRDAEVVILRPAEEGR